MQLKTASSEVQLAREDEAAAKEKIHSEHDDTGAWRRTGVLAQGRLEVSLVTPFLLFGLFILIDAGIITLLAFWRVADPTRVMPSSP